MQGESVATWLRRALVDFGHDAIPMWRQSNLVVSRRFSLHYQHDGTNAAYDRQYNILARATGTFPP